MSRLLMGMGDRLLTTLLPKVEANACYELASTCYVPATGTYRQRYTEYYSPDCNYTECCTWDPWGNFIGCTNGYCTAC